MPPWEHTTKSTTVRQGVKAIPDNTHQRDSRRYYMSATKNESVDTEISAKKQESEINGLLVGHWLIFSCNREKNCGANAVMCLHVTML